MDESISAQYYLDFRTGSQTAINGVASCAQQRAACSSLNRIRARGILEADQLSAPGQSLSIDVWEALFARVTSDWQLPLVSLEHFGIFHDSDGLPSAVPDLKPLIPGAEASPYLDTAQQAVYKLFDLRKDGSLGKKLVLERNEEGEFDLTDRPATLRDTLEKLMLLNDIGAHPTEIVGLTEDGHYLLVKQPLANPSKNFLKDREEACRLIKGILSGALRLRTTVCIVWFDRQPWIISDLHERNIMRDGDGRPTIIDALVAPISPLALHNSRALENAAEDAEALRLNRPLPDRKLFDDVDDSEL